MLVKKNYFPRTSSYSLLKLINFKGANTSSLGFNLTPPLSISSGSSTSSSTNNRRCSNDYNNSNFQSKTNVLQSKNSQGNGQNLNSQSGFQHNVTGYEYYLNFLGFLENKNNAYIDVKLGKISYFGFIRNFLRVY